MTQLPDHVEPLEAETGFNFRCHPSLTCFTECCRELELALSPYDALRLRQNLGLSAQEFMERHAVVEFSPDDYYPKVYLAMLDDGRASCPFVEPAGCRVYPDRPAACRAYPLGRGVSLKPDGQHQEHLILLREEHCQGFTEKRQQTAEAWQNDQGLTEYNAANDRLFSLLPSEGGCLRRLAEDEAGLYLELLYHQAKGAVPATDAGLNDESARLAASLDWLGERWRTPR